MNSHNHNEMQAKYSAIESEHDMVGNFVTIKAHMDENGEFDGWIIPGGAIYKNKLKVKGILAKLERYCANYRIS